jgi:predicted RNase H-like HicB family nuclease
MEYIAYLHKEPKSDFGVSFPDFPGCVTAGRTLEEARRKASEALSLHIAGMIEDGEKIPKPSKVDDIADDPALKDAVAFLVPATARVERTVRINITARESQIDEINTLARAAGLTRSAYMVQAAFCAVPKVGRANTVKNYHAKLKAKMSETKALRKAGLKKRTMLSH